MVLVFCGTLFGGPWCACYNLPTTGAWEDFYLVVVVVQGAPGDGVWCYEGTNGYARETPSCRRSGEGCTDALSRYYYLLVVEEHCGIAITHQIIDNPLHRRLGS